MVRSLGDLAKLDEPEYSLRREAVDVSELLDDIVLRFAERAAQQGVALRALPAADGAAAAPPYARIDVELFERAIANLVDNALKFCPGGSTRDAGGAAPRGAGRGQRRRRRAGASPRPTCRSSSTASTRAGRRSRRRPATAAAASAWRSSSASSSCTSGEVAVESSLGVGTRVTTRWPAAG